MGKSQSVSSVNPFNLVQKEAGVSWQSVADIALNLILKGIGKLLHEIYLFVFNKIIALLRLTLPYCIFLTLSCVKEEATSLAYQQQGKKEMEFKFQNYETAYVAKEALIKILPLGSSKETIVQQMQNAGATLYDLQGNILPTRFVESSLTMVHVVWSLAFYFNENMKLEKIEINRGLTGP